MTMVDDFLNYDETISELDWIDHSVGRDLQDQGGVKAAKSNRSRLLSADPDHYPIAASVGRALRACTKAKPCGYPECSHCRLPINQRERRRAAEQFRDVSRDRIRFLSLNLHVLSLGSSPSEFKSLLMKAKRQLRDRLYRFRIPGRGITAREAGVRLLGWCELKPIKTEDSAILLFHIHGLLDMGTLTEADVDAVFDRYRQPLRGDPSQTISKRYDAENRFDLARLWETKSTEANLLDLGGYAAKLSLNVTLGDLNGPALRTMVEHLETIRKRGMEGLRFQFGFSQAVGMHARLRANQKVCGSDNVSQCPGISSNVEDDQNVCLGDSASFFISNSVPGPESHGFDCIGEFHPRRPVVHISRSGGDGDARDGAEGQAVADVAAQAAERSPALLENSKPPRNLKRRGPAATAPSAATSLMERSTDDGSPSGLEGSVALRCEPGWFDAIEGVR